MSNLLATLGQDARGLRLGLRPQPARGGASGDPAGRQPHRTTDLEAGRQELHATW